MIKYVFGHFHQTIITLFRLVLRTHNTFCVFRPCQRCQTSAVSFKSEYTSHRSNIDSSEEIPISHSWSTFSDDNIKINPPGKITSLGEAQTGTL